MSEKKETGSATERLAGETKAEVKALSEKVEMIVRALEKILGIDINRDGKVGSTRAWVLAFVLSLTVGLTVGYAVETILARWVSPEGRDAVLELAVDDEDDTNDELQIIMNTDNDLSITFGGTERFNLTAAGALSGLVSISGTAIVGTTSLTSQGTITATTSVTTPSILTAAGAALSIASTIDAATGAGNDINIIASAGKTTGAGGAIDIDGGAGAGAGAAGGAIELNGGAGAGTGNGGAVNLTGGTGGAGVQGDGGLATLAGGTGGVDGNGGSVAITAGAAGGGDEDGGNVTITAGAQNGSGAPGRIILAGGGIVAPYVNKTANYTCTKDDFVVSYNTAAATTNTLPEASTVLGQLFIICLQDDDGDLLVMTDGTDKFDGTNDILTMTNANDSVTVMATDGNVYTVLNKTGDGAYSN